MINRRGLITGLVSLVAAPAIVRVSSIMRCSPTEIDLLDLIINREFAQMQMIYLNQIASIYKLCRRPGENDEDFKNRWYVSS